MSSARSLRIRTPEGVVFPLAIASPVSRFLALVLDQFFVYALSTIVTVACILANILGRDIAAAAWMLATFVLTLGYPMAFEWRWRGQTPGKRILHLQVMDAQGLRLQLSQIVVRNLLRVVDSIPVFYLVGGISSLLSSSGQRLGDIAANTIVVAHPRVLEPDLDQVLPGKFNSFRDHPHLVARLRQNATPADAGIALQALLRREQLDDDARVQLFGEIRRHVDALVKFPPEITDGLSDEQFVRNVVDVLFR